MFRPWRHAACSVTGTGHLRAGTPCQDLAQVNTLPADDANPALVAAVADGAGSAARSDEGARLACEALLSAAALAIDWVCEPEYLDRRHGTQTLEDARRAIEALAGASGAAIGSFACTLLGCIIGEESALFAQLGDGAIAIRTAEHPDWHLAATPERGEFANQTVFVTRADAENHLQVVRLRARVLEVVLMTDGVEFLAIHQASATPHAPFLEHVMAGLRAAGGAGRIAAHEEWLAGFLDSPEVNRRIDNDKTPVLATRAPAPS